MTTTKDSTKAPKPLKVIGCSGNRYHIGVDSSGHAVCTCPAFRYSKGEGKMCKHIREAARLLPTLPTVPEYLLLSV